jgi:predicted DNA-binding transcriptional regulator AlpA
MKELKLLLGVNNATIYRHIKLNKFPKPIHLSKRSVAYRLSVVEAWINEREQTTTK